MGKNGFPRPEKENLNMILHRVCGYSNSVSVCPITLIEEVLTYFPSKLGLHLSDRDKASSYNGLVGIGGQGIVIRCFMNEEKKTAFKIAKPVVHSSFVQRSDKVNDYQNRVIIPDSRFIEAAKLQYSLEEEAVKEHRSFVIPRVYHFSEKPIPFVLMAWVEGMDVLVVLKDKNDLVYSLEMFSRVLDAAKFLHEFNLVFRDFKNNNLKVTYDDRIALFDFGLAKTVELRNLTMSGTTLGTYPYASMKMARGNADAANHLDDIHALGYVFWEFILQKECPLPEGNQAEIENRERYRMNMAKMLPDACKKIFFDATSNNEERMFQCVDEFQDEVKNLIRKIQYRNKRQDYVATDIIDTQKIKMPNAPQIANLHEEIQQLKPPSKKIRGFTNKFLPASFDDSHDATVPDQDEEKKKESTAEAEFFKKKIGEYGQKIESCDCSSFCPFPGGCAGEKICKKFLLANLEMFNKIFLD